MPYKKTYKKRNYKKRQPNNKAVVKIVKKQLDKEIEDKLVFANTQNASITNALSSAYSSTSAMAQGDAATNRIGDKILVKKMSHSVKFTIHGSATQTAIRMLVIRSLSPEITFTADMFWYYNGTAGYEITSPINEPEKVGRYQIISDKVFNLCSTGPSQIFYRKTYKINKPCFYDRAGNTAKGHIYVFFISDEAVNAPVIDMGRALYFQDA